MSNVYIITWRVPKILQCGVKVGGLRAPVPGKRMGIKIQGAYTKNAYSASKTESKNDSVERQLSKLQSVGGNSPKLERFWVWFPAGRTNSNLFKFSSFETVENYFCDKLLSFVVYKTKDKHFTESSKNSTVFYYIKQPMAEPRGLQMRSLFPQGLWIDGTFSAEPPTL